MELHRQQGVNGRMGRVLLADDEEHVRKPIRLSLVKAGYEVVEVADGEQAIQTIRAADNSLMVDTIICDIRMPKIDGTEAIAFFRSQFPTVPVVVLTGYPDVDLAVSLMKHGVTDYLVKPVSWEELLTVVERSVENHVILKDQFVA